MQYTVFDIETDGLYDDVTKIHCLSYKIKNTRGEVLSKGTLVGYEAISNFMLSQETIVGHNIIRYDIPVLEKVLGISITARKIDTLGLSWYLFPDMLKHGLEVWGDLLGVQKPKIEDWTNLSTEEYIHRCESDVEINDLLFDKQYAYLVALYSQDEKQIDNLINYLGFKLDCAREQEEVRCKIDVPYINKSLADLQVIKEAKVQALAEVMPKDIKFKVSTRPKKPFKESGEISKIGEKWFNLLEENNLPFDYEGEVLTIAKELDGNPDSPAQVKDWLYGLGWVPREFKFSKNKAGEINQVPQVYNDDKEVCDSIKELYILEPALENLDMLSLVKHRIGVLTAFLEESRDEFIRAEIAGFTNTLRFKHKKPIANLPGVRKFYGEQIRGSIIKPSEDTILCGSDMSSLEDTTKQHYMYFFDPDYVHQMRVPGFDPHIDIGVLAKMLTPEEEVFFKWYNKTKKEDKDHQFIEAENDKYYSIVGIRSKAKTVNFAGVYGAGPPKIAQSTGMPLKQAVQLHKTYWQRNKSVKQVAKSAISKTLVFDGVEQMWLYNPVSGFWYSLRYEKDKFSTLNQGTGVYCFDLWVKEVRSRGIKITLQYHDEIVFALKVGEEDKAQRLLKEAIQSVNNTVKLNVPLDVSVDFGQNYAEIH